MIREKAQKRQENYNALKEEGFKERAGGTPPKRGETQAEDLSSKSINELNKLAHEHPEMIPEIEEAIRNRKK